MLESYIYYNEDMDESLRSWQRKGFEDPQAQLRYLQKQYQIEPTPDNYAVVLEQLMSLENIDLMSIPLELYDERVVKCALAGNLNNLTICGRGRSFVKKRIALQIDKVMHPGHDWVDPYGFSNPWINEWYILQRLAISLTSDDSAEWAALVSHRDGYSWWFGDIDCPFEVTACSKLYNSEVDWSDVDLDLDMDTGYEMGTCEHHDEVMQHRHAHLRELWQEQEQEDETLYEYLTIFVQF
jgi:hypothetical protein